LIVEPVLFGICVNRGCILIHLYLPRAYYYLLVDRPTNIHPVFMNVNELIGPL
jgi:hypothetical protein